MNCSWPGNADWKAEPFDFLINGELVRMSLEEFLLAKGISAVIFFPKVVVSQFCVEYLLLRKIYALVLTAFPLLEWGGN